MSAQNRSAQNRSAQIRFLEPTDSQTRQTCTAIFGLALSAEVRDDRLDGDLGSFCAVAFSDDEPVGFCIGKPGPHQFMDLDLVVIEAESSVALELATAAIAKTNEIDAGLVPQLWARPVRAFHATVASELGLTVNRKLHQMRAALPIAVDPVATVAFEPGKDNETWVEVNNAAFAHHPDQGSYTVDTLRSRMAEPWFNADGFRLFFDGDELAGFCWTKIHRRADDLEDLGEIYVIGLAPTHHGQGLGVPMTAAGLSWLHSHHIKTAMLYVEADNLAAIATYERLGFTVFETYQSWTANQP